MRHGSLFSGIGGFDLAAEWCGWENVFHCEWNTFGQKVLKHHFPKSISYNDITKTDFSIHRGAIDILSGGFPCQPYSSAGKRLGKEDERHLWPEMLRAIREIQPSWVVGENVRGLTNWNGGLVFDEVQSDLEIEGYEVLPFLLPACAVGAPHRRDRIWFIAYTNGASLRTNKLRGIRPKNEEIAKERTSTIYNAVRPNGFEGNVTNTKQLRLEHSEKSRNIGEGEGETQGKGSNFTKQSKTNGWTGFPTVSPVCGGDDGLPKELDNITFSKWRNESIKAYGNAIVPQVAYQIFKSICQYQEV
jgi:DNA (cytosine-5)-methyltransferase 1